MFDNLKVDTEHAFSTAHAVCNDAEELRQELAGIVREWDNISRGWSGTAASAYAAIWEEWHEGAAKVVETLAESSRRLAEAAVRYNERDADSAEQLGSVAMDMGL
ncbi:WXG100 family type VII secretion target [Mycolicibacterium thermoresistibile]|jgi:WXG100 family type VII secretion target